MLGRDEGRGCGGAVDLLLLFGDSSSGFAVPVEERCERGAVRPSFSDGSSSRMVLVGKRSERGFQKWQYSSLESFSVCINVGDRGSMCDLSKLLEYGSDCAVFVDGGGRACTRNLSPLSTFSGRISFLDGHGKDTASGPSNGGDSDDLRVTGCRFLNILYLLEAAIGYGAGLLAFFSWSLVSVLP